MHKIYIVIALLFCATCCRAEDDYFIRHTNQVIDDQRRASEDRRAEWAQARQEHELERIADAEEEKAENTDE